MSNSSDLKRIAMWSGPRNLSTAMMYSFAQRSDCEVWDEPFYAAYLNATGIKHPMSQEILSSGDHDPETVIDKCQKHGPNGKPVFYQKHMTQHMIPAFRRDWILGLQNVFLIRHPARVLASYAAKRENPTLDDIGFPQQLSLINFLEKELGLNPIIVDSTDIRDDPEGILRKLCGVLHLEFEAEMLTWTKGGHPSDGVWAPHWYGAVWNSKGFAGAEGPLPEVSSDLATTYKNAVNIYDEMSEMRTIK